MQEFNVEINPFTTTEAKMLRQFPTPEPKPLPFYQRVANHVLRHVEGYLLAVVSIACLFVAGFAHGQGLAIEEISSQNKSAIASVEGLCEQGKLDCTVNRWGDITVREVQ